MNTYELWLKTGKPQVTTDDGKPALYSAKDYAEYGRLHPKKKPSDLEPTHVKLVPATVEITGIKESAERLSTLEADIQEVKRKMGSIANTQALATDSVENRLERLELSLAPILELVEEKRRTNAHLEKVLSQLEDYLNQ